VKNCSPYFWQFCFAIFSAARAHSCPSFWRSSSCCNFPLWYFYRPSNRHFLLTIICRAWWRQLEAYWAHPFSPKVKQNLSGSIVGIALTNSIYATSSTMFSLMRSFPLSCIGHPCLRTTLQGMMEEEWARRVLFLVVQKCGFFTPFWERSAHTIPLGVGFLHFAIHEECKKLTKISLMNSWYIQKGGTRITSWSICVSMETRAFKVHSLSVVHFCHSSVLEWST
jgi:hypothetical protein